MKRGALAIATAALAAFFLWPRESQAAESANAVYNDPPPPDPSEPVFSENDAMPLSASLAAFLHMIRNTEHTRADAQSEIAYRTFYGGSRFNSYADHPVITGEKRGVALPDAMCKASGFGPGCVSTAAGAYQIIRPTWVRVRQAGAWGPYLADFSPASQDEAARRLLIECGALPLIEAGSINAAILKAGRLWASLPGSTAKQNPRDMAQAVALFDEGVSIYG